MAKEKRLISYDVLIKHLDSCIKEGKGLFKSVCVAIKCFVEQMQTVEAVEVVHGRWKPYYETFDEDKAVGILGGEYHTGWQCSVCGRYEPSEEPYCNCGAKMDGGNENG